MMEQLIFSSLTDKIGKPFFDKIDRAETPIGLYGIPVFENPNLPENSMMIISKDKIIIGKIEDGNMVYYETPRKNIELKSDWEECHEQIQNVPPA